MSTHVGMAGKEVVKTPSGAANLCRPTLTRPNFKEADNPGEHRADC